MRGDSVAYWNDDVLVQVLATVTSWDLLPLPTRYTQAGESLKTRTCTFHNSLLLPPVVGQVVVHTCLNISVTFCPNSDLVVRLSVVS